MRPAGLAGYSADVWDIALPSQPGLVPGVSMAGFRMRAEQLIGLQMAPYLRLVPYPAVTLFFDLGEGTVAIDDAWADRRHRGSVVVGLAPVSIGAGLTQGAVRDIDCLQVRLPPTVAHAVLGASQELTGTAVPLDDLWGSDAERTRERLHDTASWDERFAIASAALARRSGAGRASAPEVSYAWQLMMSSQGLVQVEELAARTGWSRKRLWSRFRSQVGITPKRAAQLVRFDHAAHRLAIGVGAARVAAEAGYADQSHLNREVMAFAGVTPTAVAAEPWLAVDEAAWAPQAASPAAVTCDAGKSIWRAFEI